MNTIQEKIDKMIISLNKERGSGRTNRVLDRMIEFVAQGTPGQKIILFALTQDIANGIQARFVEKLPAIGRTKVVGNSLEVNGVLVYFKSEKFQDNPSYKYQTWDESYNDNSIYDSSTAEYIRFLQRELAI